MIKNDANTFWLIDGSSFLFRAFYALPPLNNSKGEPTGAILGVCNMLKGLLETYNPSHIAVVFDPPGDTARHKDFPEYKANRRETPEELKAQVQPLFAIIRAMGLPLLQIDGEEADDVIGTLALKAIANEHDCIICTSDKDFAQLVGPKLTLLNTMTQKQLDSGGVIEKFGLPPERIIDFLALTGDTVDNIPGIPKVGPKTAVKWLLEYGSLSGLVDHADQIKGKVGENLRDNIDKLPLYEKLVTINTTLELPHSFETIVRKEEDTQGLLDIIGPLEFRRWIEQLKGKLIQDDTPTASIKGPSFKHNIVATAQALDALLKTLQPASHIAFDLETSSLDTLDADLVGIAISVSGDEGYYLPIAHPDANVPWDATSLLEQLKPILNDPSKHLIGHNLKFDLKVLLSVGVEVATPIIDTMLMSYVAHSQRKGHDMDSLASDLLGMQTISFEALMDAHSAINMTEVPTEPAAHYAVEDVIVTWRLWEYFMAEQKDFPRFLPLLESVEWPLVSILANMEHHGVLIDATLLGNLSAKLSASLESCTQSAHALVSKDFNLASTKQLREVLFSELQLPVLKKTPKGEPSTSEEALEGLLAHHDLPKKILAHRHMSKLKNTYTDRLPEQVHHKTKRIHCSYNQAITSTGRLSSHHPNLQNIPIKTEEGRIIREAFVAPKDHVLVCADYSQIELRIMAHWCKEPALLQAFANDLDIHAATAAELFHCPLEAVSAEQRRFAKTINFGLIYGMSSWGLTKQLGISRHEASGYIEQYFERYPGVKAYMDATKDVAHKQGYVETLLGRRIYLPEINHRQKQRQLAAERAAINGPMQGTAADIIKLAMIKTQKAICGHQATMIMQVHDELIFEVHKDALDTLLPIIEHAMIHVTTLSVPLKVNIGSGPNWDVAH